MKSTPFSHTEINGSDDLVVKELSAIYKKDYDLMPIDLYTFNGGNWSNDSQEFLDDWADEYWRKDFHPFSTTYANYLKHIGIKLSNNTITVAEEADLLLKTKPRTSEMARRYDFLRQNVDLGINKIF